MSFSQAQDSGAMERTDELSAGGGGILMRKIVLPSRTSRRFLECVAYVLNGLKKPQFSYFDGRKTLSNTHIVSLLPA